MKSAAWAGILSLFAVAMGFSQAQKPDDRFDTEVRNDFFAGIGGDAARFEKAMKTRETALAADPKNSSAMVWHGAGLFFKSGQAFRSGDIAAGRDLNTRGLREMADAIALAPDSLQTRIPRAAVLDGAAPFMDDARSKPLLEIAVADYEKAYAIQKDSLSSLPAHSQGELLGGLADSYRRLGNVDKARDYLQKMQQGLPGTPYEAQAKRWLTDLPNVGKQEKFCFGCHLN